MSTTVNVCPERASGDSPFRGASSHVTDCRWLGRRGFRVSTSVHRGPRPEHVVHKAVDRLGSATQRPESSVVLQTDPVGCCPHSKNGGRSGGAGRAIHRPGTHHGSCSSAFPGQALRQSLRESSWRASPSVARQPSGVVRRLDTSKRQKAGESTDTRFGFRPAADWLAEQGASCLPSSVATFRARPDRQLTDGADP